MSRPRPGPCDAYVHATRDVAFHRDRVDPDTGSVTVNAMSVADELYVCGPPVAFDRDTRKGENGFTVAGRWFPDPGTRPRFGTASWYAVGLDPATLGAVLGVLLEHGWDYEDATVEWVRVWEEPKA